METIFYTFGVLGLLVYIYNNSSEPAKRIKNYLWRTFNRDEELEESPHKLVKLSDVYKVPTLGSNREIEVFDNFDLYKDDLFDDSNLDVATKIYSHESEVEDIVSDDKDVFNKEVSH